MSEEKRIELEIGWCKVVFAMLAAIDATLLGWLAQNYSSPDTAILLLCYITISLVTLSIIIINIYVFQCLGKT